MSFLPVSPIASTETFEDRSDRVFSQVQLTGLSSVFRIRDFHTQSKFFDSRVSGKVGE